MSWKERTYVRNDQFASVERDVKPQLDHQSIELAGYGYSSARMYNDCRTGVRQATGKRVRRAVKTDDQIMSCRE